MLTALSIRDIVLIEKLDVSLERGLTVLTGETGAGKSILLDAFGLALGARGDSGLVRAGAEKGVVIAAFALPAGHPVCGLLAEQGIEAEGELVIRRIQTAEGPSRATINDQPVSLNLLRQIASSLAEIHGQHADRALIEVSAHRRLLDAYGGLDAEAAKVAELWRAAVETRDALESQAARMARAQAEQDYLDHAIAELKKLDPQPGEEDALAGRRQLMMHAEQFATVLEEVEAALSDGGFAARLNGALRKLERRRDQAAGRLDRMIQALERILTESAEAELALGEARRAFDFDPRELERVDERLFALRSTARKHKCTADALPEILARLEADRQAIADGEAERRRLESLALEADARFTEAARRLSSKRAKAARALDKAITLELAPLKLERARFQTQVITDEAAPGAHGFDRVEFLVAANPGTPLTPLVKAASGGELARFMLALKVVLATKGSAPTLIFDEIDTGVGGAVAEAIGVRLSRLARGLQVLAVTHSPQVAARADRHFLISKIEEVGGRRMVTRIHELTPQSRREEIARMLSGATVTEEARAQADRLIAGTG